MAKDMKISETSENKAEQQTKEKQKSLKESSYSYDEMVSSAKAVFGTRQECVAAALKADGKMEYTVYESKGIVEKFMKREVK